MMDAERHAILLHNLRVEHLLTPLSRTRRDRHFGLKPGAPLDIALLPRPVYVHYTSAEAALSIIRGKSIWMRNASCMDDWSEVRHGHQILANFFAAGNNRERFLAACDRVVTGSGSKVLATFDQWWDTIEAGTFIASVSEHVAAEDRHGRLSMWRAFGGVASRVALVFRPPAISDALPVLQVSMLPVLYEDGVEVHRSLEEVIGNIDGERSFLRSLGEAHFDFALMDALVGMAVGLKHPAFAEEREWRLVHLPQMRPSPHVRREVQSVRGTPQIIHHFPIGSDMHPSLQDLAFGSIFDRMIIGPTAFSRTLRDAFVECLTEAGIEAAADKVVTSDIPLR